MEILVNVVVPLVFYGILTYCQFVLSKKFDIKYSWMAFIPVLSGINLLWIAGKSLPKYIGLSVLFIVLMLTSPLTMGIGAVVGLFGIIGLSLSVLDVVSRRTGHGFLWALGLLIFYPILFPITAFSYQSPADETGAIKYPALSKAKIWGVVGIIIGMGILQFVGSAWVMKNAFEDGLSSGEMNFNSDEFRQAMEKATKEMETDGSLDAMKEGYDEKSAQTANISHLSQITMTLTVHYVDQMSYPEPENGCLPNSIAKEMISEESLVNSDPVAISPPCTVPGKFGYGLKKDTTGAVTGYYLTAKMNTEDGGNYAGDTSEYHEDMETATRGAGDMYVIVR